MDQFLKHRSHQMAVCLIMVSFIANGSFCQSSAQEYEEGDLFDFASRLSQETLTLTRIPLSKTPGTVSIITAKQIEENGASSLDEVIGLLPGVDTYLTPMGFNASIRGFSGSPFNEGIQFLVDGLYFNSSDKGGSSANPGYGSFPVPLELVKQVEVVREPNSAIYGPNAFYGVVNVITKSGKDFKNGGKISVRVGTKGSGRSVQKYTAVYGGANDQLDWTAAGEFFTQRGPMEINDRGRLSSSRAVGKIKYENLVFSWFNQVAVTEPLDFGSGDARAKNTQQSINLVGIKYKRNMTKDVSIFAKSGFVSRRGSNCQVCHNPTFSLVQNPEDQREWFQRFFQEFRTNVNLVNRHQVTMGAEFIYDKEHMDSGVIGSPRFLAKTYSGFLQDVITITEDVSATVGVRQDSSDWSTVGPLTSPRVLFVYTPTEMTTLRTSYSMAHRVPTFHDRFIFMKFRPQSNNTQFLMGSPNLKPETVQSYSVGVDQWLGRNILIKANGYYNLVQNQIDRREIDRATTIANLPNGLMPNGTDPQTLPNLEAIQWVNNPANAHIIGGEFEVHYRPHSMLDMTGSYSYKNIAFSADISPLMGQDSGGRGFFSPNAPNAPKHIIRGSLTVYPLRALTMNVTGRYRAKFFTSFPRQNQVINRIGFDGRLPQRGTFYLDFNVGYRFPYGFKMSLIGRNMLDRRPKEFILPVNTRLMGRDLFAQVTYDFGGTTHP